ncbi:antitoxin [Achromobacter spanius]|uniref:Nitrogen regulatory protein n=1 Tax=Achromobacter spanius TaxID=217203 RepID=A0AAW3I5V0_9BURK|nr:AbrB/MazE/SpoVT family DNA-binding domain-containing protein [Achromobacter spanius]KNE28002.1 nitrogen regulatory protein [Achromobacter spanius]
MSFHRRFYSPSREAKLFRIGQSQAVCIPAEFELPGDRVMIRQAGTKLILEPMAGRKNIVELLAQWRMEEPLGRGDHFPDITDAPSTPDDIL